MTEGSFVPLAGSERETLSGVQDAGPVDESERIEVTLVLRRRAELPAELVTGPATISTDELAASTAPTRPTSTAPATSWPVTAWRSPSTHPGSRRIKVAGTAAAADRGVRGDAAPRVQPGPGRYRAGRAPLPGRQPEGAGRAGRDRDRGPGAGQPAAGKPAFPAVGGGRDPVLLHAAAGRAGLPVPGGHGRDRPDDRRSWSSAAVSPRATCSPTSPASALPVPSVTAVSVDGASNAPGSDPSGADGEVLLDIEVAGSVAPGAAQVVYFAPNTDQAFVDAISAAAHATPTPIVISISWGGPEDTWSAQSRTAIDQALSDAAALGITVTVAAGDNGSSDGVTDGKNHCDYPASSPYALACGGTRLDADTGTGAISSETVWNDGASGGATGGGVSAMYSVPSWQASAGVPPASGTGGRGVPDVAGNADPQTGYQVLVDGKQVVYGGTSAVAPLWAALIARLAQATGRQFGLMQPLALQRRDPGHDRGRVQRHHQR